jgi:hypothetical protein
MASDAPGFNGFGSIFATISIRSTLPELSSELVNQEAFDLGSRR